MAYMQDQNGWLFSSLSFSFTVEIYNFSSSHQNIIFCSKEKVLFVLQMDILEIEVIV